MSTQKTVRKIASDPRFNVAANNLISTIKTPVRFAEFLTEAMSWCLSVDDQKKRENAHFHIELLMTAIAIPWMKAKNNHAAVIAAGLFEVYDAFGCQNYHQELQHVMFGFYKDFDGGYPSPEIWTLNSDGINVLLQIYPLLWNIEMTEYKEQRKSSKK